MKPALVALVLLAVACGASTDGPDPQQGKGDTECPAGLTSCGGTCVDLQADPNHRGACGIKVCGGLGEPCCDSAVTGGPACFDIRGVNNTCCGGRCVDLQTDPNHRGACGIKVCGGLGEPCCDSAVTGGPACFDIRGVNNTCCGGRCVDLQTDPNHHGACGQMLPQ